MNKKTSVFSLSLIALAIAGCNPAPVQETTQAAPAQVEATQSESAKLASFFEQSFDQDLKRSPMYQSYLGLKWNYGEWDDISQAGQDEDAAIAKERLAKAKAFDRKQLSAQENLSLDIYIKNIQRELANDDFRNHNYIMDQFRAWHTVIPSFMINIHRVSELSDAEAYVSRLNGVKPLLEEVVRELKIREKLGVFPPQWSYDQMLQASENVIKGAPFDQSGQDSTIWKDFQAKVNNLELDDAAKQKLLEEGKQALINSVKPGYEDLITELTHQKPLSPEGDGVWRLPNGTEWYQNRLSWFTTTDLDADQVHQIGLENVDRIHNQMREIMKKVNFEGSLQDFFVFMRTDPQFYYENTDEGRQRYMTEAIAMIDDMKTKLPDYFGLQPKADMIVKRVEAFREQSAGKAFYQSPSKDGSRPGIYYANLYRMEDMPTYQMEALAYHEGIPGHHMQLSISQELEGVPEFQKYVSFTVYSEGWGLYTEELAKDMGAYQDPYSDFGRLAMELWRACRLVVDTGLHSKKWSREQAIDYLIANTPNPENDAVKAIERYIAMPGQATAYMIGKLKIMELREKAQKELGDQFDFGGFHDEILKDGPVPLDILQTKIDNWIASKKQS